ncbi:MAG TPA: hypothetical protein DD414_02345 [Lachnospiraceae bacterium]|nr:hypothetical protein [Lachnospiraceae bacterium]
MVTEADRAVLDESYKNTRMGREAINTIIGKVEDDELALDLNRQACKFVQLEEKIQKKYQKASETPPEDSLMNRTMLWGGIQMNTLLNASTEHIADMMIQGNTKGITELMKVVKKNKGVQKEYYELAQELMDFEEKNIEKLKAYLR